MISNIIVRFDPKTLDFLNTILRSTTVIAGLKWMGEAILALLTVNTVKNVKMVPPHLNTAIIVCYPGVKHCKTQVTLVLTYFNIPL